MHHCDDHRMISVDHVKDAERKPANHDATNVLMHASIEERMLGNMVQGRKNFVEKR